LKTGLGGVREISPIPEVLAGDILGLKKELEKGTGQLLN